MPVSVGGFWAEADADVVADAHATGSTAPLDADTMGAAPSSASGVANATA
jgi:hypothetical protein